MNKKIFDMNSSDTFNTLWLWEVETKEVSFPPWLKAPSYYIGNV